MSIYLARLLCDEVPEISKQCPGLLIVVRVGLNAGPEKNVWFGDISVTSMKVSATSSYATIVPGYSRESMETDGVCRRQRPRTDLFVL